MKKITITIDTTGVQFSEDPHANLEHVIGELEYHFERFGFVAGEQSRLFDKSSHVCGSVEVE